MAPEKTHSQNPSCSPAWEKGAGVAPKGPSTKGGRALFSTEMVFVCLSPIFPLEPFLHFCSPSCLLESLNFMYDFLAARALSSQEVTFIDSDFPWQL